MQSQPTRDVLLHLRSAAALLQDTHVSSLTQDEKQEALTVGFRLVAAFEEPRDKIMRQGYAAASQQACLRLGIDLGIFKALTRAKGEKLSAAELAEERNAEELLVVRVMRVLVSIGYATQAEEGNLYSATTLAETMTQPSIEATVRSCSNDTVQIAAKLPIYFRARNYTLPTSATDCPLQWTFGIDSTYFDWVKASDEMSKDLHASMQAMRFSGKHWTDWYPVRSHILDGADSESTLLVDVGGGFGHDLEAFFRAFPETQGRLVLQDLPEVLARVPPSPSQEGMGIRVVPHDFFRPQPERGARVYYFHHVFHNWSDERAMSILRNLVPALVPGYSKILLNESVLPDRDCPAMSAAQDINMMCILGGQKRARQQWMELVRAAGLEVVRIWESPHVSDEAVIEAMLPS